MNIGVQIKENLISRIKSSDDLNFLKALQTIFDSSEQSLYELNKKQIDSIEASRAEIQTGEIVDSTQAISDMKKWLEK